MKKVVLLIETSRSSGRSIIQGITRFAQEGHFWSFFHQERNLYDPVDASVRQWKPDGIIARIENRRQANQLLAFKVPMIDLLGWVPLKKVPSFGNDREKISQMAYQHFKEKGFENFAYCGFPGLDFSDRRGEYFQNVAKADGKTVHLFLDAPRHGRLIDHEMKGLAREKRILRWLRSLPKPIGLLTCNDLRAQQILTLCEINGLLVPEEIAVLGVDNDPILTTLCSPTLSSIELNNELMGYEAAKLLQRMMSGEKVSDDKRLIPPQKVVCRRSSDAFAFDNDDLALAKRFIQSSACSRISVNDVCTHVNVSASTLKRLFQEHLKRSPKAEIFRVQIETAKELLGSTTLSLKEIAQRTGFLHPEAFGKNFRKATGMTPGTYRRMINVVSEE